MEGVMKRLWKTILIILTVFFAAACRMQPELSRDFDEPSTWGETFDIFWKKMSTNYCFWSLDYGEGREWDSVYDEYKEQFDALGLVDDPARSEEAQRTNTLTAYRYFFDITNPLSDGHFALQLDDNRGNAIVIQPSQTAYMRSLGYTDDEIFRFLAEEAYQSDLKFNKYNDYISEDTVHIMEYSFDLPGTGTGSARAGALAARHGFSDMQYVHEKNPELHIALGKNDDGIVYFGFSGFAITYYFYIAQPSVSSVDNAVTTIVQDFFALLAEEDTAGVIIDLRGNGGGFDSDLSLLWTAFMPEDADSLTIAEIRRKASENRIDYTVWLPYVVERSRVINYGGTFDSRVPIAILMNERSGSCAELSIFTFMTLRDTYDYNVRLFGTHSHGGMGVLTENAEKQYNAGQTAIPPYITLLYTPFVQTRYLDEKIYEGTGIPADETVPFDADAFQNGNDPRLAAVLEWIS